ncbi:rna-directed dna polymerase from mobile element jockey-like [Willisornis vidua]|uniref:Rna-directed dna polymerase from mobile element jockey-like n=1 Tax=Willisornis vidua TaxID=1566151 RepID=A0ABQ9DNY9_9PASS|nr:rna-directed dna polymerase from mobile element jockey-like [Willisornis vidua]
MFIRLSPRTDSALPARFNPSLTQTVKCDPEAMENSFITLTLSQECPELQQGMTKCNEDLHDIVLAVDHGIDCTLSKFADDTKLSGEAETPEGLDAMERDLDKLEKWVYGNLLRFNKDKCKTLHLSFGSSPYQYRLRGVKGLRAAQWRRNWHSCG